MVAFFAFFAGFIVFPQAAHAGLQTGIEFGTATGLSTTDIRTIVGNVIRAFFALLGIVAVVLFIYAGFLWMTAGGNEEKITTAKRIMVNATIGLVIIMSSYAIVAFILRAVTGEGGFGSGGGGSPASANLYIGTGSGALGSGVLDTHYPEAGQTGVPRNTKVAVTFKRPLVLSTVIKDYDDKGTIETSDDVVPAQLLLNTDNVKLIRNDELSDGVGADSDVRFNVRYANAVVGDHKANVTVVTDPETGTQSLKITLAGDIGSPTEEVNYRIALRGGNPRTGEPTLGVQVWQTAPGGNGYVKGPAFSKMDADGGYFWSFSTSTTIDNTPPKIVSLVPVARANPNLCDTNRSDCVFRNQLLQVYFDEPVDPTSASGLIGGGAGGGFNNIDIKARCRSGKPCDQAYATQDFSISVPGAVSIGNRYRTVEFLPSTPCEGVSQNSCGEPVYCLPKNVELYVIVKAAAVDADAPFDPEPPMAIDPPNGIVDMVGNSFDGNRNSVAEGPPGNTAGHVEEYSMNELRTDRTATSDSAGIRYFVGEDIDLVPPKIIAVDPPSTEGTGQPSPSDPYNVNSPQSGGSSKVPVNQPIKVTWSKIMSVTSVRTGAPTDTGATVVLDANECAKESCTPPTQSAAGTCKCTPLDPPAFDVSSVLEPSPTNPQNTVMVINHRTFFTANDLGYTEQEAGPGGFFPRGIPKYVPSLRAQLRDDKQNCFFPSRYDPVGGACAGLNERDKASCCNKTAAGAYSCPP